MRREPDGKSVRGIQLMKRFCTPQRAVQFSPVQTIEGFHQIRYVRIFWSNIIYMITHNLGVTVIKNSTLGSNNLEGRTMSSKTYLALECQFGSYR